MVRIIAGQCKGFHVKTPHATNRIRPTSDRVKEALFSILGNSIVDTRVLDLFCGSGNLGLEALSRGASFCCFVEKDPVCLRCLQENITHMKFQSQTAIFKGDIQKFIVRAGKMQSAYDVVFADPPYNEADFWFSADPEINLLKRLFDCGIVTPFAVFVLEHHARFIFPEHLVSGREIKRKHYGDTALTIITGSSGGVDYHGKTIESGGLSG